MASSTSQYILISLLEPNGCPTGEPAYRSLRRLCTVCHRVGLLARSFLSSGSNLGILFCFSAVKGGADRIEVCANLGIGGGTTPTIGLLKSIQNVVDVPIMVRLLHFKYHILIITLGFLGSD